MRAGGVFLATVAVLLAGGAARLAYIEAQQGPALRRQVSRQQTAYRSIPALRGEILDTRGRVLAGTVRRPSVFVDPALVQNPGFAAHSVAPLLGLDPGQLEQMIRERRAERFVWLRRRIADVDGPAFAAAFDDLLHARRLRAFGIQWEPQRIYPQARLASHVLGFVGADLQGLAGVELEFQAALAGSPGRQAVTVDVVRRRVRTRQETPVADGCTVVLTIDAYIQQTVQDALRAAMDKHQPQWATAVVMDPQSGEVLAMACLPDFDPAGAIPAGLAEMTAAEQEAAKERWRNRAVSDAYEPGSVFKPFVASCAVADGLTSLDEVFVINGPVRSFGRRTIRDTHAYDALPVHRIVSKSSNIGMGLIGARCGIARLHEFVLRFGFGAETGIALPGEHAGLVSPLEEWNPRFSPQSVPIGQEIAVTPIQIVTAFSVFCNGGLLLRPRIVRGVIGPDGETVTDNSEPVVVRRVLDERASEAFRRRALVETVRDGTGKRAALADWQVFGKTGTAQIAYADRVGYAPGRYVASFVGGAPAERPRVVVLVSIYRPTKEGYYGGVVAAPVVKEIIAETLAYMRVPPAHERDREPAVRMLAGRH